jgi:pyridoxine kinase
MGIQVCPVPTAVLSTQTDGYEGFSFVDLTASMPAFIAHWESLGLEFEGIYTGFLGSARQIEIVAEFIERFSRRGQVVVVDPVMADGGVAYSTCTKEMQDGMVGLVRMANVVTPNLSEACLLLGEEYPAAGVTTAEMKRKVHALSELGPGRVVITSVLEETGRSMIALYDRDEQLFLTVPYEKLPVHYPGTGDVFASVLTGQLVAGAGLALAVEYANDFTTYAVNLTFESGTTPREGILLEKALWRLFCHQ